ncbi:hypothetical protein ABK040_004740 [Willaertia magna]
MSLIHPKRHQPTTHNEESRQEPFTQTTTTKARERPKSSSATKTNSSTSNKLINSPPSITTKNPTTKTRNRSSSHTTNNSLNKRVNNNTSPKQSTPGSKERVVNNEKIVNQSGTTQKPKTLHPPIKRNLTSPSLQKPTIQIDNHPPNPSSPPQRNTSVNNKPQEEIKDVRDSINTEEIYKILDKSMYKNQIRVNSLLNIRDMLTGIDFSKFDKEISDDDEDEW